MEGGVINSLTPFNKVRMALSRFSRKTRLFDTLLVQNWIIVKIGQTFLFLILRGRRTDWRTDVVCV